MQDQGHEVYMRRCLQLAALGAGKVAPNPMVGAVLVADGTVIGEGWHQNYGGPHAEVHCITDAVKHHSDQLERSTLYVSLEPCAHYGKTPPCADLIIRHKIPKVVIGCRDSFEKVDGKGIAQLRKAGTEVITGVLEREAVELNRAFFTFHEQKRPYIILKWAQTADGFIAGTGNERLLISNDYSNRLVHKWRTHAAAIMVGANTAIKDDPLLDNRNWAGPAPKKILFDPHLKVTGHLRLFKGNDVVFVINTLKDAVAQNILYVKADKSDIIKNTLHQLYQLNIQSIWVEGGRHLLQSFIDAGIWDEACVITNKGLLVHGGLPAPLLTGQAYLKEERWLSDEIIYFKNIKNNKMYAAT
ncbi:bifunctional diaminohydroxyphosphoribosylaminopyrimidine deaminase/5-amino-6-(5-phosphoribosylamino)uracil reductase RibD [Niabella aquatica]